MIFCPMSRVLGIRRQQHDHAPRKPKGGELPDWQKEFNKQVNKIRNVIEQGVVHFNTWRIMHTGYRRPLATFPETTSVVVALHFYATA
jgi:hypothetical protein